MRKKDEPGSLKSELLIRSLVVSHTMLITCLFKRLFVDCHVALLMTSLVILYQTEDGKTKIEVRLQDETVWLTQKLMAELFQTTKQNISLHIQNIFDYGELMPEATVKEYLTVQTEGLRQVNRPVDFYNLEALADDEELKKIESAIEKKKKPGRRKNEKTT